MDKIIRGSLPNFPTLEQVKEGIERISSIDINTVITKSNAIEIHKELDDFFMKHLQFLSYQFMQTDSSKFFVPMYRVRKFIDQINPYSISEFSFLPHNLTNEFSRANIPNHPVFYCSPDLKTSIFETISDELLNNTVESESYFVAEWKFRPDYYLNITPYIIDNISNENLFKPMSDNYKNGLKKSLKELNETQIEIVFEVLKYMSNLFIKDNYVISSYIANKFLYASHNLRTDVFMYPSIKTNLHTVNFAIQPNTVLEKMQLQKVFHITIADLRQFTDKHFTINFILHQFAENINGHLVWQQPNDDVDKYFKELFGTTK